MIKRLFVYDLSIIGLLVSELIVLKSYTSGDHSDQPLVGLDDVVFVSEVEKIIKHLLNRRKIKHILDDYRDNDLHFLYGEMRHIKTTLKQQVTYPVVDVSISKLSGLMVITSVKC